MAPRTASAARVLSAHSSSVRDACCARVARASQFRKIADLANAAQRELVDVLGVVHSVSPVATINRKDGSSTEKRSVYIRDDTAHTIEVTLWTPFATREGSQLEQARAGCCRRRARSIGPEAY